MRSTQKFSFVLCLILSSIFLSLAAQASIETRLATKPLEVKSDQRDECAMKQLKALRSDWRQSSEEEKQAQIDALKNINTMVLNPTIQSGHLTGNDYALDFRECQWIGTGRERHEYCNYFTKPIGKNLSLNGSNPKAKYEKVDGQGLVISTEALRDDHVTIHYQATSRHIYNQISNMDSPDFETALRAEKIYKQSSDHHSETICAETTLKELAASVTK